MLGVFVAEEGNHGFLAQGRVVAESAFGLTEHLREDLVFEVCVGVGVVDYVDHVLGEEVGADYAADLAFAVVEVGGPGVGGYHFGGWVEGGMVLLIREIFNTFTWLGV